MRDKLTERGCHETDQLRNDLIKDHWMWNYSWRGVKLEYLEKGYGVPAADILTILRDIAHKYDPPDVAKLPNSRCESCGMRIFWGKLNGGSHPFDPKILVVGTDADKIERGRESHFVSCPNAKAHRKSS